MWYLLAHAIAVICALNGLYLGEDHLTLVWVVRIWHSKSGTHMFNWDVEEYGSGLDSGSTLAVISL